MLLAVIRSALGYPASTVGMITGTPEVHLSRSFRTRERSSQCSNARTGYGPNCFTTFWTQLTYRFNGRTTLPLERTTAPGGEEPTSRCQTFPLMWTLGEDQHVTPRVTSIRSTRRFDIWGHKHIGHKLKKNCVRSRVKFSFVYFIMLTFLFEKSFSKVTMGSNVIFFFKFQFWNENIRMNTMHTNYVKLT